MLRLYKYNIPFKRSLVTGSASIASREGLILVFDANHFFAYGEIAPLPGFSNYDLNEVIDAFAKIKPELESAIRNNTAATFLNDLRAKSPIPSLLFGINTLIKDYESKSNGYSMHTAITGNLQALEKVKCNAVIGIDTSENTLNLIKDKIQSGFDTIKVKMGRDFDLEYKIINQIRSEYPTLKIRVDGNENWDVNEAVDYLNKLEELEIEYCEQPISGNDIQNFIELKEKTKVKIAADELVRSYSDANEIIEKKAADILIIKPMLFGTFNDIAKTYELAKSNGIELVFTTSLENEIGRQTTAIIAGVWGSKLYAHGLATAALFSNRFQVSNEIDNGYFVLKQGPGLDLNLDYSNLTELDF